MHAQEGNNSSQTEPNSHQRQKSLRLRVELEEQWTSGNIVRTYLYEPLPLRLYYYNNPTKANNR